jgi:tRNA1Val (adenine37-N6)-methyltransferase
MIFKFKQFSIDQTNSPFKVGTDGVLAGALCPVNAPKNILDIGTGTGLIALMLAQRCNAKIDAIEINQIAFNQAKHNFKNSPWVNKINVHHCALQNYNPGKKYAVIISNPPYFQSSLKSDVESKNKARHTDSLTPTELVRISAGLLSSTGKLCLIYPVEQGEKTIALAKEQGMYCTRIVNIKPTPDKKTKRLFLEFEFSDIPAIREELIVEQNGRHQYSKAYKKLTKKFYLNL